MQEKLNIFIERARTSKFWLWLLNAVLLRTVPFNKPHNIRVIKIDEQSITLCARNQKSNRNHIRGVHACLLATMCEYVSGLNLLRNFSPKEYRIILKTIQMTYHFQAKSDVFATFSISPEEISSNILGPLKTQEAVFREFKVDVYDVSKNHICTGLINWQIKAWKHVKAKI